MSGRGSFVRVALPQYVGAQWEQCWWDVAQQHMILVTGQTLHLWSPDGPGGTSMQIFQHANFATLAQRSQIMLCKLSMDMRLLAVQCSSTTLEVYDVQNSSAKPWKVAIKSPYDNRIISGGIVWSDHCGGSQDLVLVTLRGLEMWKVSPQRGTCKLSRTITQGFAMHAHFWYEPNFRCIVLASPLKSSASSSQLLRNIISGIRGGTAGSSSSSSAAAAAAGDAEAGLASLGKLALNGYFFKISKETMPKLELPPPDKTPQLLLDAGTAETDVSLLTLYGSLYVGVRARGVGSTSDVLNLYRMDKTAKCVTSVSHSHVLVLGGVHRSVRISVVDNLLLFHSLKAKQTTVFDIRSNQSTASSSGGDGGGDGSAETLRVLPVCPAGPVVSDPQWGSLDDITAEQIMSRSAAARSRAQNPTSASLSAADKQVLTLHEALAAVSLDPQWDPYGGSGGREPRVHVHSSDAASRAPVEGSAYSSAGASPGADSHQSRLQSYCARDMQPCLLLYAEGEQTASVVNPASAGAAGAPVPVPVSDAAQSTGRFRFVEPCWVWDTVGRLLWRLRACLADITSLSYDPRLRIGLLLRRGQTFRAERPVYFHSSSREDAVYAKKLIIHVVGSCVGSRASFSFLEAIFQAVAKPYAAAAAVASSSSSSYSAQTEREPPQRRASGILSVSSSSSSSSSSAATSAVSSPVAGAGAGARRVSLSPSGSPDKSQKFPPSPSPSSPSSPSGLVRGGGGGGGMTSPPLGDESVGDVAAVASTNGDGDGGVASDALSNILALGNTAINSFLELTQAALVTYAERLMGSVRPDVADTLEPRDLLQSLLADITLIGGRRHRAAFGLSGGGSGSGSFYSKSGLRTGAGAGAGEARPFSPDISPSVPLCTRRDPLGNLVVTQTELISHLWLPLLLLESASACQADFEYISYAIMLGQSVMRGCGADVHPVTSLCLLKALAAQSRYMEIGRLLQLQFFADSADVGLFALDLCDAIDCAQQQSVGNALESWFIGGRAGMDSAVRTLRQVGLDMLWRLGERATVVRWLLAHGRAVDAMRLCNVRQVSSGQGQGQGQGAGRSMTDVNPATVSGIEFYDGMIMCLLGDSSPHPASSSSGSTCGNGSYNSYAEKTGQMYALYRFVLLWDPRCLEWDPDVKDRDRSRLAAQSRVGFPPHLLRASDANRFLSLFGFPAAMSRIE